MKLLFSRMWPEPAKAQGSTSSRILNQCHGNRCLISVFWPSQQVYFLPCPAIVDAVPQETRAASLPVVTVSNVCGFS
jgi:hypothetical protein